MAHIVKCRWCGEPFDTEILDESLWIKPNQRSYYHKDCYEEKQQPGAVRPKKEDDSDDFKIWFDNLYDFIERDLKGECDAGQLAKGLQRIKAQNKNWTYKGIYFAFRWYYGIKKNPWEAKWSFLGIIPHIYYEGTNFWREQERKSKGVVAAIEKQLVQRREQERKTIKRKKENPTSRAPRFSLEDIEVEDE